MVLNGPEKHAKGYIEGLEMLASMRLCANVAYMRHSDRAGWLSEHQ
ncbi:hypothetical protein ACLBR5_12430 [Escherichia coli]